MFITGKAVTLKAVLLDKASMQRWSCGFPPISTPIRHFDPRNTALAASLPRPDGGMALSW